MTADFLLNRAELFSFNGSMTTQSVSLSFAPSLIKDEGGVPTRFTGVAYSGGVIPGYGFFGDVVIDLSTMKAPTKPIFALLNHDFNQRVGKCEVSNSGQQIAITGSFSSKTQAGHQVAAEFSEDAPWEFSVGINAEIESFKKPTELLVNGQSLTVNAVFRNARVYEVSFVPAGADPNTHAVAFAQTSLFTTVESPMSDDLKDKLDSVTSLNADLQVKLSAMQTDHAKVVAELQAKIHDEAKAHLDAVAKANELQAEISAFKASVRSEAVKSLFADLHKDYSDDIAQAYQAMSDEVFAVVAADLRECAKPKTHANLFREVATNGATEPKSERDLAMKLFNQVAGVK